MARHELRREAWLTVLLGAGISILGGGVASADAAETETRIFNVKIDGKQAGRYKMIITSQEDHELVVSCRADVSTSYLLVKFHYFYEGTEIWKNGRLVRLKSRTNDDGKQFQVVVQADGDALRVWVNGKEPTIARPDVLTTTYWCLPDPKFRNQGVALLDCDNGKVIRATLRYVGTQQLSAAGQVQNCEHYSLRGGVQVDAWYDAQERLVREESVEDGHQIVLELVRMDR